MDSAVHSCTANTCKKPDDELMVSCEKCKRWWHYDCHGFDPDKYDTMTPWYCEEEDCVARIGDDTAHSQSRRRGSDRLSTSLDEVEFVMEAAVVAQAAVAQRDKELLELRAELEETKLKLSKFSNPKAPANSKVVPPSSADVSRSTKLDIIKKIQANHQVLLKTTLANCQSTPVRGIPAKQPGLSAQLQLTPDPPPAARDSSFRDQDMANLLTILNRNNVQDLPIFSGENKREWPYFEEVYKSTTIEGRYNAKENVARLRKSLKGEAYQLVSDRLKYSLDADGIIETLRTVFGRYDVLVHDLTSDLLSLPKLTSRCDPQLRLWSVKLNGFVADLKSMSREEDLTNGFVLTNLASRLGAGLYQEWQRRKAGLATVDFQQFAEFVTGKVIELPPDLIGISELADKKRSRPAGNTKASRVLLHQPVSSVATSGVCCKCNNKHYALSECKEFLGLTPDQRQTFAKENFICFTCLDPSKHQWKTCAKKRACRVEGCSRRHHPLLHKAASVTNHQLDSTAVPFVPQPHIHSSHHGVDVNIMFKVVPIRIHKGDLFVDTHAFLDDGSSLSMIDEDLFNYLGLDGQSEQLTLQWTNGVSRVEESKRTSFSVSGINHRVQDLNKCSFIIIQSI